MKEKLFDFRQAARDEVRKAVAEILPVCADCISRAAVLNLIEQSCCDLEYDCDNVALRKEVEALPSAQPVNIAKLQPNCNQVASDCISRQAMINEINLHVGILYDSPTLVESLKLLVRSLPSAQTERKKGKWIERNPRNSPDCRLIECSECGNAYIVGYNINYDDWIDGRNFCMKCGADLRGGSNGKST